jgi:RHS repeat-associated protein
LTRTSGAAVTNYAYDFENRLIASATASDSVSYEYDELGNRVSRSVNGTLTRFLVDSNRELSHVVAELDATGTPLAEYTVGDDLISQQRGTIESFYHYDGNGSTRLLSANGGAVTDTYDYDAFGNLLAGTGTTSNEFLHGGEQLDTNVGFYYLRARYMDPTVGRFISRDPFPGNPFDPPSLHGYSYALNNPANLDQFSGSGHSK